MRLLIFFLFIFFLLFPYTVVSIGIIEPSYEERYIVFQPNIERHYEFTIGKAEFIHSFKNAGVLDPYVTVNDPAQDSGPRPISADIKLPEKIDPGLYYIFIGGLETSGEPGTVSARAGIQSKITVLSLYPGKYLEYSLTANDVGVNEKINFSMALSNYGIEDIGAVKGIIDIYDPENNFVQAIYTNTISIKSVENKALIAEFYALNLKPGIYKAVGRIEYDGIKPNSTRESFFRIGSLNIIINDYTREVIVNATNRFEITITSDWVGTISGVYGRVYTPNQKTLKTPNLDINKFQTAKLETYWETKGLEIGEYDVVIEIFYEKTSIKKTVKVNVIDGIPPIIEKPKTFEIKTTTIAIIAAVILALINIGIFFYIKKPKNKNEESNQNSTSIQPPKSLK